MRDFDDQLPGEFDSVASALRMQRTRATELELDRIKLDARRRAVRRARSELSQGGLLMRSRLFVTAMVAGGILMLGGGAALGVSGLSSTRSASIAQYGTTTTAVTNQVTTTAATTTPPAIVTQEVAPTQTSGEQPSGGILGENKGQKPAREVQAVKQVASNELPFTGYLAIPVLVLGLVMLAGGLALRRSGRRLGADG
jgi:uncharacterized protein GlcG (DUF336 family)